MRISALVIVAGIHLLSAAPLSAAEVLVAVASNFAEVADRIGTGFEEVTGHRVRFATGSTGKLYAQIRHGAPFDVLLAADRARPDRLVSDGLAVVDSQTTYAVGRLALWGRSDPREAEDVEAALRAGGFRRLAIANPELSPYGVAARQTLEALGLAEAFRPRLVFGENIGQTFALVRTGNAELGFVALAQLHSTPSLGGRHWLVPEGLHAPIRQDAVLLERAAEAPAARAFVEYLTSPAARDLIRAHGYGTE